VDVDALGPVVVIASEAILDVVRFIRTADPAASTATLTTANASPATVMDFAVQAYVASRLARHCPDDPLVA
jgi:3'-phosphoadenosine 5'-phosphosulfate (PAPS) 3'-phosphatase